MKFFARPTNDPRDSMDAYGPAAVRTGQGWNAPGYPGAIIPLVPMVSHPLPQRNEGLDTRPYAQPIPREIQYQSFWRGNQLPISTIQTLPHVAWVHFRTQDQLVPQRKQGSFTVNLSQLGSANILSRWHDLWSRLGGSGSGGSTYGPG